MYTTDRTNSTISLLSSIAPETETLCYLASYSTE